MRVTLLKEGGGLTKTCAVVSSHLDKVEVTCKHALSISTFVHSLCLLGIQDLQLVYVNSLETTLTAAMVKYRGSTTMFAELKFV